MTWYYARVRWAVMVEGRGLREWKEPMFMLRAVDREAAFEGAENRRGWVENRLAGIVELGVRKGEGTIGFEHQFEPERSEPRTKGERDVRKKCCCGSSPRLQLCTERMRM